MTHQYESIRLSEMLGSAIARSVGRREPREPRGPVLDQDQAAAFTASPIVRDHQEAPVRGHVEAGACRIYEMTLLAGNASA
jgi:hypothetical protein